MNIIDFGHFNLVELRVGTVLSVEPFPEARKAAYKITVDFGSEIGTKRTSAQVTDLYSMDELVGKQVIGVVNFPPKQIGPFVSEFLLTGLMGRGGIVLAIPERQVPNGEKLL